MNSENYPIVFYFPYKEGPGGVNVLFLRLSDYLADNSDHEIFIADYENGYMVTHNTNKRVRELYLKPDEPLLFPEDAIIILQSLPPWHLPKELKFTLKTRLIFWNLHPHNLLWDFKLDNLSRPLSNKLKTVYSIYLIKQFISELLKYNALIIMDGENKQATEAIINKYIYDSILVPVPTEYLNRQSFSFSNNFAWLGRLADFKISILIETIKKLAEYALKKKFKINFMIIGDGPDKNIIVKSVELYKNKYFKVNFVGEIDITNLETFLINNVSVLFAMGTSALDGARLGIPVVLLDFSYKPLKGDYIFRFLYETKNFTLARDIGDWAYESGNTSLENIIYNLLNDYDKISNKCFEYVKQNHEIDVVAKKFINLINNCKMDYRKMKKYRNGLRPYLRNWL